MKNIMPPPSADDGRGDDGEKRRSSALRTVNRRFNFHWHASIFRPMTDRQSIVLDARAMDRTLRRMADEIVELNNGTDDLILVGIQRRGIQLAARIVSSINAREGVEVPTGALDITLYRDDLQTVGPRPVVGATDLPWALDGKAVIIVDDVLYTGRTIRAPFDELTYFAHPRPLPST